MLHDPPYVPDGNEEARKLAREYGEELETRLSEGRRGDDVELFFTTVGVPGQMVDEIRQTPRWAELEEIAPTVAYDSEVMGDVGRDGSIPVDRAGPVEVSVLVLTGGADLPSMTDVGRRLAEILPWGQHRILEGQEHVMPPEVLVPVLSRVPRRLAPEERGPRCQNRKP